MKYPKTGSEVYVSLNLSNTMLTGIGKGTITREEVSASYLKRLFAEHGVIVSAKPEQRRLLEIVNERYDLELEIPETLKLFQLTEEHRRLVVISVTGLRRKNGSLLPEYTEEEFDERVDAGKLPACVRGGYDLVDVRDVAAGCVRAALHGRSGECYILSNRHYEVRELLELARRCGGGRRLPVLPAWMAKAAVPFIRLYARGVHRRPLYTRYSLHTLQSNDRFSHDKATAELGFFPRDIARTVADTVLWLRRRRARA